MTSDSLGRFKENPNMLITDTELNLLWWPKDSYQDLGRWMNWNEAIQYIRTINSVYPGGFSDFRLPTGEEMKKFFNFHFTQTDHQGETIHIHPLFNRKCAFYLWSTDVNEKDQALRINLRTGVMEFVDKNTRELHAWRCCRTIKP